MPSSTTRGHSRAQASETAAEAIRVPDADKLIGTAGSLAAPWRAGLLQPASG